MRVDEMEAGRELDALVAEKVGGVPTNMIGDWMVAVGAPPYYRFGGAVRGLPDYSTDIAAILPVAEQVVGTGHIKIKLMPPDEWNELYLAQVALWLGYIDPVRTAAEAATGGQAIALALARAVVKAKETTP